MRPVVPALLAAAAGLFVIVDGVFLVSEHQVALVSRLNRPLSSVTTAGLHTKIPLIDRVEFLDRRLLLFAADGVETSARDGGKRFLTAVLLYRVTDPMRFRAAYPGDTIKAGLQKLAQEGMLAAGRRHDARALSADRTQVEQTALEAARLAMRGKPTGLALERVVLTRVDLTPVEQAGVLAAMQAANRIDVAKARADHDARKRQIAEAAAREEDVILAPARAQAAEIRAETARQRAAVLDASYRRNPHLAAFFRSMRSYEQGLADGRTTLVLSPDSPFLKYLKGPPPAPPKK